MSAPFRFRQGNEWQRNGFPDFIPLPFIPLPIFLGFSRLASENPAKSGEDQVAEFKSHGATNVESLVLTREEATNRAAAARLDSATGVYFTGGDQSRLAAILVGSPVHQRLKGLYARGAIMGGTSAGAAVMSQVMITGEELLCFCNCFRPFALVCPRTTATRCSPPAESTLPPRCQGRRTASGPRGGRNTCGRVRRSPTPGWRAGR